jgi:catechol 2,3-dioxygenase-like lactoylglutathione lyase family enzyme
VATFRMIVTDVPTSVDFYSNQLGFKVLEQYGPAMAILQRDDMTIWLAGPPASASRPMPDGAQPVPGGWNRIVVPVDDIEATVSRLRASGATFRNDVVTGPGGKQILLSDPSGNVVELFESG